MSGLIQLLKYMKVQGIKHDRICRRQDKTVRKYK